MDQEAALDADRVPASEWPRLGAFTFRHNRLADGRVRCLHGDQGHDEADYVRELAGLPCESAAFWRISGEGGQPLGVIGCEFDVVQARAWLRGPWTEPGPRAASMAGALLRALEAALPNIQRFDAFPSQGEEALNTLYRDAGYRQMAVHRVMQAALQGSANSAPAAVAADPVITPAVPTDVALWLALHHALFPGAYLTDSDIEAALGDERRLVLTGWLDGRRAGYLIANDEPALDEIYIDFIGVEPACRGKGVGRSLLLEALRWGRARSRRNAALTVRQDREDALSLYRQCGFSQLSAGVHWRKGDETSGRGSPARA
jgi:ribosomal protein S18 acetylase RimI-like enzyme